MREEMTLLWPEIEISGIGLIIVIIGFLTLLLEKRKKKNCSAVTEGKVVKHSFINETPSPIVEYNVGGMKYRKKKYFRGSVTVRAGGFNTPTTVYVDEKDVVHIRGGAIINLRKAAQELYPIGSYLKVFYNPQKPKQCYVDKIPNGSSLVGIVLMCVGFVYIVLGIIISVL